MVAINQSQRQQAGARGETLSIAWAFPNGLVGLSILNMVLRVATLGIYHFWATTEVRRRIWASIRIDDEPLLYTGRGIELFVGFLIAVFAVFLPASLLISWLSLSFGPRHQVTTGAVFALYGCFAFLFGYAIYRAQRYRLARTRWRGIRCALEGNGLDYAWTFLWTTILLLFTLGWLHPWRATRLQSMITNRARFGDRQLIFSARSGPLYGPFAVAWIGAGSAYLGFITFVVALAVRRRQDQELASLSSSLTAWDVGAAFIALLLAGIIAVVAFAWYRARTINHFAGHTFIGTAHFNGRLSAGGLIWIGVTNYLIIVCGAICLGAVAWAVALAIFQPQDAIPALGSPAGKFMTSMMPLALLLGPVLVSPITQARSTGYLVRKLSLNGAVPVEEIAQATGSDVRQGEGLAEVFDIDVAG